MKKIYFFFLDKSIKWAKQREDDTENCVHTRKTIHTQSTLITSHGGRPSKVATPPSITSNIFTLSLSLAQMNIDISLFVNTKCERYCAGHAIAECDLTSLFFSVMEDCFFWLRDFEPRLWMGLFHYANNRLIPLICTRSTWRLPT